jgi:tetratricopeptide (TPR) repeat protein
MIKRISSLSLEGFRVITLVLFLSVQSTFSANTSSSTGETPSELSVLNTWMENAGKTAVGNDLLKVLNTSTILLKQNPKNAKASFMRGYLYGIIGCTGYAIADLSKAIQDDPSYAAAYSERGICYMDLKMYDRAKYDLEKAMSLNPYSADARFAHGKLMLEMDRPQTAESDFRACQNGACKFNPVLPGELPSNYYNGVDYYLGVSCEAQGKLDSALKYFKTAAKAKSMGGSGYIKRYSDQPLDAAFRVSKLEVGL